MKTPIWTIPILLVTATATAQPVCIPRQDYADAVKALTECGKTRRDLAECRRQVAAPLPQPCTPVRVVVDRPVPVVVERSSWIAIGVGVVVGFIGGAVAAWRLMR
jgi:hypothetical protein